MGRLKREEVDKVEATLDRVVDNVNGIWAKCGVTVPTIVQFKIATNDEDPNADKRFVYALDLEALPPVRRYGRWTKIPVGPTKKEYNVNIINEYKLCPLLEGAPKRNLTAEDGVKEVTGTGFGLWDKGELLKLPPQELNALPSPDQAIEEAKAIAKAERDNAKKQGDKDQEHYYKKMEEYLEQHPLGEIKRREYPLALFRDAVVKRHGRLHIDVFVLGDYKDTGKQEWGLVFVAEEWEVMPAEVIAEVDEAGIAETPGDIFLDEVVILDKDGRALAHAFGHSLGLSHALEEPGNLMHRSVGTKLRPNQCEMAAERAEFLLANPWAY